MPDLGVKREKKALILMFENSTNCGFFDNFNLDKMHIMSYFDKLFLHFLKYTLKGLFW